MERTVCISLERRSDRWREFVDGWPMNQPLPVRWLAVDGQKAIHPSWWRQGRGAWGCYKSHMRILEECLNDGVQHVTIFEDDALFVDDFSKRLSEVVAATPDDWQMLYLGGQHLYANTRPPRAVNDLIFRPFNINRTHAYMLRNEGILIAYQHLCDTTDWKEGHHLDHHYGRMVGSGQISVYCPKEWLVGQRAGKSNINGKEVEERFWPAYKTATVRDVDRLETPFVMIMGLHRSGSSCLAGLVARLGVHMGNKFVGCEEDGGHEAAAVAKLCEAAMRYPSSEVKLSQTEFRDKIKPWIKQKCVEAKAKGTIAGMKYPQLCVFGPAVKEACGNQLRVIHIDRPLPESIQSAQRRSPKMCAKKLAAHQRKLWQAKRNFLSQTPHLTVTYEETLSDPLSVALKIAEFLGLPSDRAEFAATYVKPEKRKIFGK